MLSSVDKLLVFDLNCRRCRDRRSIFIVLPSCGDPSSRPCQKRARSLEAPYPAPVREALAVQQMPLPGPVGARRSTAQSLPDQASGKSLQTIYLLSRGLGKSFGVASYFGPDLQFAEFNVSSI
eukprot:5293746-Pleurochrysis_carterae.AAC.2